MISNSCAQTTAILFASASIYAPCASAQTSPATDVSATGQTVSGGGEISEIIVTAQRREQNLQKASLTIQVLGGRDLEKAGVTDVAALQKLAPGVSISNGGGNGQIYIRGVGDYSVSPLSSPGVAFNVDGVYIGRPDGLNGNFYDVARIEVLKGPQGTLYGRNANGGSVNVITNDAKLGARTFDLNLQAGNPAYASPPQGAHGQQGQARVHPDSAPVGRDTDGDRYLRGERSPSWRPAKPCSVYAVMVIH